MTRIEFTVLGDPAPQGSKTLTAGGYMREDNPRTAPWRAMVAAAAHTAMNEHEPMLGPLRLQAVFCFRRPAFHFGTGRNARRLKESAPAYRDHQPDLDKLVRAVGDAITGIVCRDDAQLAVIHAEKHYGQTGCALIVIEPIKEVTPYPTPGTYENGPAQAAGGAA